MTLIEIACFSPESAAVAIAAGADRIELCNDQNIGGVTPPLQWLEMVKKGTMTIPVFVMIRPRGGDFNYSDAEFQIMKDDIERFKSMADGFVFGILGRNHKVDIPRTRELVRRARPKPCTFHRAFDETLEEAQEVVEQIIDTGCQAILSSGRAPSVVDGLQLLRELVKTAAGRITIIAGGGVRSGKLAAVHQEVLASVYHSSAIIDDSAMPDADEIRRLKARVLQNE